MELTLSVVFYHRFDSVPLITSTNPQDERCLHVNMGVNTEQLRNCFMMEGMCSTHMLDLEETDNVF